jgi:colanic acid/amylovoran biosynthesis glycosyltransferase
MWPNSNTDAQADKSVRCLERTSACVRSDPGQKRQLAGPSGNALMTQRLSWSLAIATYNRRDILPRCLRLAAQQSLAPLEIIVVDASPDWEVSRAASLAGLPDCYPGIRWQYVPAQRRSIAVQRNQAIRLSHADIMFLIDDDSLMYPDCAEQIMQVYQADVDGAVAGVMACETAIPPDVAVPGGATSPGTLQPMLRRWKDWLLRRLNVENYLLPYEQNPNPAVLPKALQSLRTFAIPRMYGACMTFRRRVVQTERFEEVLEAYSYLEDCDAGYRASRRGLLLLAQDARLCHVRDPSGRLSDFTLTTLGAFNALVLHRLHSRDQDYSRRVYRSFLGKQVLVMALRDLSKMEWSLPRARGILRACHGFRSVFRSSPEELREWYPRFQRGLIARDPSTRGLRLGYFVPEFPSQTHAFFWREIDFLRRLGTEVHLLSTRRPPPWSCRHSFAEQAIAETHYVFPPGWLGAIGFLILRPARTVRALGYIAALRESPLKKRLVYLGLLICAVDLRQHARRLLLTHIHIHSCADAAHVGALCGLLGGPAYSLTLHGDLPVYGADHACKMREAKFVACVTASLKQQVIQQVGKPAGRVHVICMGVDTERFRDGGSRAFESRLHLITVARLNPMKGHRYALEAMRAALERGCDLRYTIAGDGPSRSEIEKEIHRLGLTDRVTMTSAISEDAILKLLQEMDAFVLPSVGLGEAAPVSLMEAMSCGLPVVCSIIGGTPDMVTHAVDGLLTPQGDVKALTDTFVLLAQNPEERRRLGQAARARAKREFDVRETSRRLLEAVNGQIAEQR